MPVQDDALQVSFLLRLIVVQLDLFGEEVIEGTPNALSLFHMCALSEVPALESHPKRLVLPFLLLQSQL